jgi:mannosyltransferase OCH1-like enzyme
MPALRNQGAFDRSSTWHQKSDILRYELLWAFGGVYVDADSLALRPLDPLLANVEMFAGYEQGTSGLVATGVIGCTPRHPNMERMIRDLSIDEGGHAWELVGPLYFTRMIERYQMQVTIHPARHFYPIHHTERMRLYRGISPSDARLRESFLVQYWGTTTNLYEPWPRRIARRLRYALGR